MVVVLGLDDGDRDVGLVVEDLVIALLCSACMSFPPDINSPIRKTNFLANLCVDVPTRRHEVGRDKIGVDVAFT